MCHDPALEVIAVPNTTSDDNKYIKHSKKGDAEAVTWSEGDGVDARGANELNIGDGSFDRQASSNFSVSSPSPSPAFVPGLESNPIPNAQRNWSSPPSQPLVFPKDRDKKVDSVGDMHPPLETDLPVQQSLAKGWDIEEAHLKSSDDPLTPRTRSPDLKYPHGSLKLRSADDHPATNLHSPEEFSNAVSPRQSIAATQTTIYDLPVEIVTRILTIGCEDAGPPTGGDKSHHHRLKSFALIASKVCTGWREIIRLPAGSQFWIATVYVSDRKAICEDITLMKSILETSLSCDIDARIESYSNFQEPSHSTSVISSQQRLLLHSIRLLAPYSRQLLQLIIRIPRSRYLLSILAAFAPMPRIVSASIVANESPFDARLVTSLIDVPSEILDPLVPFKLLNLSTSFNCSHITLCATDITRMMFPPSLSNLSIEKICPQGVLLTWKEVVELFISIGTIAPSCLELSILLAANQLSADAYETPRELRIKRLSIISDLMTFTGIFRAFSMPALEGLFINFSSDIDLAVSYNSTHLKPLPSLRDLTVYSTAWTDTHDAIMYHLLPPQLGSVILNIKFYFHYQGTLPVARTYRKRAQKLRIMSFLEPRLKDVLAMLSFWDTENLTLIRLGPSRPYPAFTYLGPDIPLITSIRLDRLQTLSCEYTALESLLQLISQLDAPHLQSIDFWAVLPSESLNEQTFQSVTGDARWKGELPVCPQVSTLTVNQVSFLSSDELHMLLSLFPYLKRMKFSSSFKELRFCADILVPRLNAVKRCCHIESLELDIGTYDSDERIEVLEPSTSNHFSVHPEILDCIDEMIDSRRGTIHPLEIRYTFRGRALSPRAL
jgi:hypothetical protein